jgi:hypothetical protein
VNWFEKRRKIVFKSVASGDGKIRWKISGAEKQDLPGHIARIHYPANYRQGGEPSTSKDLGKYRDIPLLGNSEFEEILSI